MGDIQALGGSLVAISPQLTEHNKKLHEEKSYGFDILFDAQNTYSKQLGLTFVFPEDLRKIYSGGGIDLPTFNDDPSWTMPMPGRFVIDAGGVIQYAEANPDYTYRPEPEETLQAMRGL